MTYKITKEFAFSASHTLTGLDPGHQCSRLHGHNYVVVIELCDDGLDDRGFVIDYGELVTVKNYIDATLDHRHLNDALPDLPNPTAEYLAAWLFGKFAPHYPQITAVRVSETPKTWAEYSSP